jgi:hypothetical protein
MGILLWGIKVRFSTSVKISVRHLTSFLITMNKIIILISIISISSITLMLFSMNRADAGFKTIKMQKGKTYHCHKRGSGKILNNQSNFECELMRQDSKMNAYDYVSTSKIVNLYCANKMNGGIEYDEGTIYKYLMICKK